MATPHLWPLRPHPQDDELFTSWLLRLARVYRLKPHTFCQLLWPGKPIWNRDIDKSIDPEMVHTLSSVTGVSVDRIHRMSLAAYSGVVFQSVNARGFSTWLLPLGIYHRVRRRAGLQYCPRCLQDDREPYFRRRWRLAFVTLCERHGCQILARCQQCGAPIEPHRVPVLRDSLAHCGECARDLRSASPPPVSVAQIRAQRYLLAVMEHGWTNIPGFGPVHSILYFVVLRQIAKLLIGGPRSVGLRRTLREMTNADLPPFPKRFSSREIECLEPEERGVVFAYVNWLLAEWPERFAAVCREAHLWRSWACRDMEPSETPFWFQRVVDEHLYLAAQRTSDEEVRAAFEYARAHHAPLSFNGISRSLGRRELFRKRRHLRDIIRNGRP